MNKTIRLLSKFHLIIKMPLFALFFDRFWSPMYAYALKIYQKTCTKITHFSNQSEFQKKSIIKILFLFNMSLQAAAFTAPPENTTASPYPTSPFQSYISGSGIVEPSSDNIGINTPMNRLVEKVTVSVNQEVKKGEVLIELNNSDLQNEQMASQMNYAIATEKLKKLLSLPRPEDLQNAQAALQSAQLALKEAKMQNDRVDQLQDTRALSKQNKERYYFAYAQAQAHVEEAEANLKKIKAGAWEPDIALAKLEIEQAKNGINKINIEIDRTFIRSPIDGRVLQIKIHPGEYPASLNSSGPLMIVGNTDALFLKVSINQFDASYFDASSPAVAFIRGNAQVTFPLAFVKLEPLLVNKQNLNNEITDKVDTKVLQVIYHIQNKEHPLFVGQQMDVFIQAHYPRFAFNLNNALFERVKTSGFNDCKEFHIRPLAAVPFKRTAARGLL